MNPDVNYVRKVTPQLVSTLRLKKVIPITVSSILETTRLIMKGFRLV